MKKITDYIYNNRGLGFLVLLAFSLIMAAGFCIKLKNLSDSLIPSLQEAADQILPIKIENGTIVTPDNMVKTVKIQLFNNMPTAQIPFIIDTTVDTLNPTKLKDGIYLTRTTLYTVSQRQTKITALTDSIEIPKEDYTDLFETIADYIIALMFIIFGITFFVAFMLISLFYTLTALLIGAVMKRKTDFDLRMRLSVCAVTFVYTLSYITSFAQTSLSGLTCFALIIFLQGLIISGIEIEKE